VRSLVRRCRDNGTTVFLTTHDMHVADALCDRVAFLVDGAIRELDSPRSLKLRHGRRKVSVEVIHDGEPRRATFSLDELGHNEDFLAFLRSGKIETIHSRESTLDDVFRAVTGRTLS